MKYCAHGWKHTDEEVHGIGRWPPALEKWIIEDMVDLLPIMNYNTRLQEKAR